MDGLASCASRELMSKSVHPSLVVGIPMASHSGESDAEPELGGSFNERAPLDPGARSPFRERWLVLVPPPRPPALKPRGHRGACRILGVSPENVLGVRRSPPPAGSLESREVPSSPGRKGHARPPRKKLPTPRLPLPARGRFLPLWLGGLSVHATAWGGNFLASWLVSGKCPPRSWLVDEVVGLGSGLESSCRSHSPGVWHYRA